MQPIRPLLSRTPALLGVLLLPPALAGCEGGAGDAPPAAEAIDTTNQSAMDGLSREQIRAQSEALPPEQAEAMGIIDSVVHIPDPTLDTLTLPPREVRPPGPTPP